MQEYLKKDLIKVVILAVVIIAILVGLTIWDLKTGILEQLAGRYV